MLSLPAPTKMFQFGASPLTRGPTTCVENPIRRSRVQRLLAPTPGLSQLATSIKARDIPLECHTLSSAPEPSHPPRNVADPYDRKDGVSSDTGSAYVFPKLRQTTSQDNSPMLSLRNSFGVHLVIRYYGRRAQSARHPTSSGDRLLIIIPFKSAR